MTDDEISKVARDAFTYGAGFMRDGKHVPMENVYMSEKDAATKDLVTRLRIGAPTIEKCYEAAKRIEGLEELLKRAVVDAEISLLGRSYPHFDWLKDAHVALEKKDG